jgi:hypothetical protein
VRGTFDVDEGIGPRWELALELLRHGEPFALGNVTFNRIADDAIEAAVAVSLALRERDRRASPADLEPARDQTEALLTNDAARRAVVGESRIDYVLVDDYDVGSVAVCRLIGHSIEWLIDRGLLGGIGEMTGETGDDNNRQPNETHCHTEADDHERREPDEANG